MPGFNFHHPNQKRVGSGPMGAYMVLAETDPVYDGLAIYVGTTAESKLVLDAATEMHEHMCMLVAERQDTAAIRADELCPWWFTGPMRKRLIEAAELAAQDASFEIDDVIREAIVEIDEDRKRENTRRRSELLGAPICAHHHRVAR